MKKVKAALSATLVLVSSVMVMPAAIAMDKGTKMDCVESNGRLVCREVKEESQP